MHILVLRTITLLHIIFLLFVIVTPFTNSNYFMLLHSIFIPFLLLHWALNDNTCALTIVERYTRKQLYGTAYEDDDCITCRLIEPVYNFNNDHDQFNKLIIFATLMLWSVSMYKLYLKYKSGEINSWKHLFIM
jgi:hypothetical protein